MADHNDPNAVNSIFSDIDVSAAGVYDLFGFPSDEPGDEKVVIALTFASVPKTGILDSDMLYRIFLEAAPRIVWPAEQGYILEALLRFIKGIKDKYLVLLR